jgi:ubiquinol-cytochrome c reductase cytochrome b subunit
MTRRIGAIIGARSTLAVWVNCYGSGEEGGQRGPTLDGVGTRLAQDQLMRQMLQGGSNMSAYGEKLTPVEVTAGVAFMQTLSLAQEPPARSAVVPATPGC